MTEPARVVQRVVVRKLERVLDRAADSPKTTPSEVSELWLEVRGAKSDEFFESLKQDSEIANLRLAEDVEIERRRADGLAARGDELSRSNTGLAQRVQQVADENEQMVRTVTALREELGKTKAVLAAVAQERDETKAERDGLQAELKSIRAQIAATIAEHGTRLRDVEANRSLLEEELVTLKRERAENKSEKTIQELGRLLLKPELFARHSELGTLHEPVRFIVEFLAGFYRRERGIVALREKLELSLTAEQRGFVEADRSQLRDKAYPKFVNRRDLVRRLRPADTATVDGLLTYRREWDRGLAGQTVRQDIIDKLFEGMAGWKERPTINSLHALSKACGVDRATLKKFHDMGLVDLGWCINDAKVREKNPRPNKKRRT